MTFKVGQVANPHGRPPAGRSFAEALRKAAQQKVKVGKHWHTVGEWHARMLMDALTTGEATFADGKILRLSPSLWVDLSKFVYTHVDGPARAELDVTSGGQPLKAYIGFTPDEWDAPLTVDEPQRRAIGAGK